MCFELCPLDYHPPVVVHHTIPTIQEHVVPGYGRFLNNYNPWAVAPLSGHRFGPYSGPRDLHQGRTFMGPVIAPGLNSRVTASAPVTHGRQGGFAAHVLPSTPTVNGRTVPGYGNGVVNVRRGI